MAVRTGNLRYELERIASLMIKSQQGGKTMDSTKKPFHPPFDPVVADRLLSRLGEDDGFRELFANDPEAALREVGHPDAAAALAGASCMKVEQLASKEQILACRERLKHDLTSANPYTVVYSFDTGGIKDRLRRE